MLCQICSENPATIHFTEIKGETKRELHICEECANKQGLGSGAPIPAMLADLVQGARRGSAGEDLICPDCGMSFDEFRTKGRFGCPRDYEVFEKPLRPLLEKIHGARRHTGRLPRGRSEVDSSVADRLLRLRRALQDSVKTENYEDAARLRDEIRALERVQTETEAGGEPAREQDRGPL